MGTDIESIYLVIGIALAGVIAALASIFTGLFQFITMKKQSELNRQLELEKITHESKIKKLQNKIAIVWIGFFTLIQENELKRFFLEYVDKIKKDKLSFQDNSSLILQMVGDNYIKESFEKEIADFSKDSPNEKLEKLSKYYRYCFEAILKDEKEKMDKLDSSGWSIMLEDITIKNKIIELTDEIAKQRPLMPPMSSDEEKGFVLEFRRKLDEVQNAISAEIHLKPKIQIK